MSAYVPDRPAMLQLQATQAGRPTSHRHALGGEGTDLAGAVEMVRGFARARGIALSADPEQARAELRAAYIAANARALATLTAARPN